MASRAARDAARTRTPLLIATPSTFCFTDVIECVARDRSNANVRAAISLRHVNARSSEGGRTNARAFGRRRRRGSPRRARVGVDAIERQASRRAVVRKVRETTRIAATRRWKRLGEVLRRLRARAEVRALRRREGSPDVGRRRRTLPRSVRRSDFRTSRGGVETRGEKVRDRSRDRERGRRGDVRWVETRGVTRSRARSTNATTVGVGEASGDRFGEVRTREVLVRIRRAFDAENLGARARGGANANALASGVISFERRRRRRRRRRVDIYGYIMRTRHYHLHIDMFLYHHVLYCISTSLSSVDAIDHARRRIRLSFVAPPRSRVVLVPRPLHLSPFLSSSSSMGLTKDQLRRRTTLLRLAAKRGRVCAALLAILVVLACVFGGFIGVFGAPRDLALDTKCVRLSKAAQSQWFDSRACAYDAYEARADFVAAELALTVRAKHEPGACAVLTLGLPEPGAFDANDGEDLLALTLERSSESWFDDGRDEELTRKMGFWMKSMTNAGAFECATRTYAEEDAVETLKASLAKQGHDNAIVGKLKNDRTQDRQLDEEFAKIAKASPTSKLTVLINDAKRSQSQFTHFKKGLASKKVSTLIWRREITSTTQRKALLKEVKYVARFGYSVYLAGATQNADGGAEPTAFLRIDHQLWDDKFATPNTGIELTIVAVARDNKFKRLLDESFTLCPVRSTAFNLYERGRPICVCEADRFSSEMAEPTCGLENRLSLVESKRSWFWGLFKSKPVEDTTGFEELDHALDDLGGEDYDDFDDRDDDDHDDDDHDDDDRDHRDEDEEIQ